MTCPRCDAPVEEDTNFCVRCGQDLRTGAAPAGAPGGGTRGAAAAPPSAHLPPVGPVSAPARSPHREVPPRRDVPVDVSLVACPSCGATNAATRERCGRCHAELAGGRPPIAVRDPDIADPHWGAAPDRESREARVPRVLVLVTVLAAVAVGAVVVALLGARGIGWFAPSEAMSPLAAEGEQLVVDSVDASSQLSGRSSTFGPPANAVDGDPESAWVEGVGGAGAEEWLELVLAEPALVRRVIVWNGNQRGELFPVSNRVGAVRIDIGDRTFTGDLLDRRGPQAIDLPEPVRGDRVRLTIDEVVRGERGIDTAISEVELYGDPASPDGAAAPAAGAPAG